MLVGRGNISYCQRIAGNSGKNKLIRIERIGRPIQRYQRRAMPIANTERIASVYRQ